MAQGTDLDARILDEPLARIGYELLTRGILKMLPEDYPGIHSTALREHLGLPMESTQAVLRELEFEGRLARNGAYYQRQPE